MTLRPPCTCLSLLPLLLGAGSLPLRAGEKLPHELVGTWRTHLESASRPAFLELEKNGHALLWLSDRPDAVPWRMAAWYDEGSRTLSLGKSPKQKQTSLQMVHDPHQQTLTPRRAHLLQRTLTKTSGPPPGRGGAGGP